MLNYNEIKRGKIIIYKGEPYKVLSNFFIKKNRNKATNSVDLKSLISGKNINNVFRSSDRVEEADIEKTSLKFLYQKRNEVWFSKENNPKERFFIEFDNVGDKIKFLKPNDIVTGIYFNDNIIGIDVPIKVSLEVKEAPPAVKGNTASGATKRVILENGLEIFTPLFIKTGDIVVVNTETGEYTERVG